MFRRFKERFAEMFLVGGTLLMLISPLGTLLLLIGMFTTIAVLIGTCGK